MSGVTRCQKRHDFTRGCRQFLWLAGAESWTGFVARMRLRQIRRVETHVTDDRKLVYRGKIVDLYLERVTLPNGSIADFEIVQHPGGAAVVALDRDDRVCLLRQYRYVAGGWLWELPAGKLDPGEPPLTTAQRELEEEAGLRAARWEPLGRINSSPGIFTEVIHLFLASGLTRVPARNEIHELIEVHWIPFAEALALAETNEITDGKTLVGLFRAQQWRERGG